MEMPSRNTTITKVSGQQTTNKQTNKPVVYYLSFGMGHPGARHTLNKKHRRSQNFN